MLYTGRLTKGIQRAADFGCEGVEFNLQSPAQVDAAALKKLLESLGLQVTALGTGQAYLEEGLSLADADPAVQEGVRQRLRDQVDLARHLGGAAVLIGGIRGRLEGDPGAQAAEYRAAVGALQEVADYAATRDVELLVEPINRYETNFVNSIGEGLALIDEVGRENLGLLADTFHMNIEERSFAQSLREAGERLRYVHLVDSNRWAAGFGHIDFDEIFAALYEMGYEGSLCAEVLPLPDDDSALRQHVSFVRSRLKGAG
jgi:sugar phosphate isomerase/epimerase